jgi:hypothetical protein
MIGVSLILGGSYNRERVKYTSSGKKIVYIQPDDLDRVAKQIESNWCEHFGDICDEDGDINVVYTNEKGVAGKIIYDGNSRDPFNIEISCTKKPTLESTLNEFNFKNSKLLRTPEDIKNQLSEIEDNF